MIKRILYILLLLSASCRINAAVISFIGDPPVNRADLERGVKREGLNVDSLQSRLYDFGYFDAVVGVENNQLSVQAGPRCHIRDFIVGGPEGRQTIHSGAPFQRAVFDRFIDELLAGRRQDGYFFAAVTVNEIRRDGDAVDVVLSLNDGPCVKLADMRITGLSRTNPELVKKYLRFTGDMLTDDFLRTIEARAAEVPFVTFNRPAVIRPRPGYTTADLELDFKEKPQVLFEGGAGYSAGNNSSLFWHLNLRFQNLFGHGRQVNLFSEHREENRQVLDLSYTQPFLLAGLGSLGGRVATRDYRDEFYEFGVEGWYQSKITEGFDSRLSIGWRSVEPTDALPSFKAFTAGFGVIRDGRDSKSNPTRGLSFTWAIDFSNRRYANDSLPAAAATGSFNETRNRLTVSWYRPISGFLVNYIRFGYCGLETAEPLPPLSELFFIGGPQTVRGFRNEQFAVLRAAYGTIEPHFHFNGGYGFVFYDAAYINNRVLNQTGSIITEELFRNGYGVGLTIIDNRRIVKLSLGWNPEITFDQPRLSVELSTGI